MTESSSTGSVIVVGGARSGTTLLYRLLVASRVAVD